MLPEDKTQIVGRLAAVDDVRPGVGPLKTSRRTRTESPSRKKQVDASSWIVNVHFAAKLFPRSDHAIENSQISLNILGFDPHIRCGGWICVNKPITAGNDP